MNTRLVSLISSLALIIGGIVFGRIILVLTRNRTEHTQALTQKTIFFFRNIAFFVISPFVVVNAFWLIDFNGISFVSVPLIGLAALMAGSGTAVLYARALKLPKEQEGAMFCSGSCSNLGSFGSYLCFVFLGEIGIVYAALYRIFETPYYYLFMFPTAKDYAAGKNAGKESRFLRLIKDPIVIIFFSSIVIGIALNMLGIPRPAVFSSLTSVLIPLSTAFLLVPIGYTMRLSKIGQYRKEVAGISVIKYVLTPLFVIGISLLLGLHRIDGGALFKALVVLSALPAGFMSLVPVQMFGLDLNLANANWIITTGLLIPVIAIVWVVIG